MNKEVIERVINVISRTQKIPRENITVDKTLEELGIDSFDGVNLLFALEDEFNVSLPDDAKGLKTVSDVVTGMQVFLEKQSVTEQV
jgi:acyl carrier protein